jgi:hypothetical protein
MRFRATSPPLKGAEVTSGAALRSWERGAAPACGSPGSIWGTGMNKGLDPNRIKEGTASAPGLPLEAPARVFHFVVTG